MTISKRGRSAPVRAILLSLLLGFGSSLGLAQESAAPDGFEPNETREAATRLEIGKAIEATIAPTKDQDWYRVEVPERGLLHVVIDPVPEDLIPALILHGEDGKEIGRWQGRCRRRLEAHREIGEAATLYLLVVNGPFDEGENNSSWQWNNHESAKPYGLEVTFESGADPAEPNDDGASARTLAVDSEFVGTVFPTKDVDHHALELPEGARGVIALDLEVPDPISPLLVLYGPDGKEIGRTMAGAGLPVILRRPVTEGGRYIALVMDGNAGRNERGSSWEHSNCSSLTPYRLKWSFWDAADANEPDEKEEQFTKIESGKEILATLFPVKDTDNYVFDVPPPAAPGSRSGSKGWRRTSPPSCSSTIRTGSRCAACWSATVSLLVLEESVARAGTYRLHVGDHCHGWGENGSSWLWHNEMSVTPYRVRVDVQPVADQSEPNDEREAARPLPLGEWVEATLFPIGDHDYFKVEIPGAGRLRVEVSDVPDAVQPVLRLYGKKGNEIAIRYGEDGRDLVLERAFLTSDEVVVLLHDGPRGHAEHNWSSEWNNRASRAPYRLRALLIAAEDPSEPNDAREAARDMARNQEGEWTAKGAVFPRGDHDYFAFEVPEGAPAEWEIIGTGFEPPLSPVFIVYRPNGSEIKRFEVGTVSSERALVHRFTVSGPGKHCVLVCDGPRGHREHGWSSEWHNRGALGTYEITVRPSKGETTPADEEKPALEPPAHARREGALLLDLGSGVVEREEMLRPPLPEAWFKVRLPVAGRLRVEASEVSGWLDPQLEVHAMEGEKPLYVVNGFSERGLAGDERMQADLAAGEYLVRLADVAPEAVGPGGSVALRVAFEAALAPDEPNDAADVASRFPAEGVQEATLFPAGDEDCYLIDVSEVGTLEASLDAVDMALRPMLTVVRVHDQRLKSLYICGGRTDYNLPDRFREGVEWTRLDAAGLAARRPAPDPADPGRFRPLLSKDVLADFDAVVLDGLKSIEAFELDRRETQAEIESYVEGGGRFVLLCPQAPGGWGEIAARRGGKLVRASSSEDDGGRHARNLIDGAYTKGWVSKPEEPFPHEVVFEVGSETATPLDTVVFWCLHNVPGCHPREVELAVSTESAEQGFRTVGRFELVQDRKRQEFRFDPAPARYVLIRILSNHGDPDRTVMHEVELFGPKSARGFFGAFHQHAWSDAAIAVADADDPVVSIRGTGPFNGWSASDHGSPFTLAEGSGLNPVLVLKDDPAGVIAATRRIGEGVLILDAQEVGYPGNTAGDWRIPNLLDFPNLLIARAAGSLQPTSGTDRGRGEKLTAPIREPGTYVIRVSDRDGSASRAPYRLSVRHQPAADPHEPNDLRVQAVEVQAGEVTRGTIDVEGDRDWYRLAVNEAARLHLVVRTRGSDLDPVVTLHRGGGEEPLVLNGSRGAGRGQDEGAVVEVAPGTVFVEVRDTNERVRSGEAYELDMRLDPLIEERPLAGRDAVTRAVALPPGQPCDLALEPRGASRVFELAPRAGSEVEVRVRCRGRLLDPRVEVLRIGPDTGGLTPLRVLHLAGRHDFHFEDLWPWSVRWTRVQSDHAEARTISERFGEFDVVILDNPTTLDAFGWGEERFQERALRFAEAGGRFLVLSPSASCSEIAAVRGGRLVRQTSQWDGNWAGSKLIDGRAIAGNGGYTGWCCGRDQVGEPQELVFEVGGSSARRLDRILIHSCAQAADRRVKGIEISIGLDEEGPFETVAATELPAEDGPHEFRFPVKEARFVRLLIKSNHGSQSEIQLGEVEAFGPDSPRPFGLAFAQRFAAVNATATEDPLASTPEPATENNLAGMPVTMEIVDFEDSGFRPVLVRADDPSRALSVARDVGKGLIAVEACEIGWQGHRDKLLWRLTNLLGQRDPLLCDLGRHVRRTLGLRRGLPLRGRGQRALVPGAERAGADRRCGSPDDRGALRGGSRGLASSEGAGGAPP